MSEHTFRLQYNGQQVQQADLNDLGTTAGLADDRVFAELFRMTPSGASPKGILPYASYAGASGDATLIPAGASGSVALLPFRAFVGGRVVAATDARKTWQDIRSGLSVAEGATSLTRTQALAANSSGLPRWDLVYAVLAIDANGDSVSRKVKDPTTSVVSTVTTATFLKATVAIGAVTGTPNAIPVWPSAPADSGSNFYIPLAYVLVPNGFNASSTVAASSIVEVAPMLRISRSTGAISSQPANKSQTLSTGQQQVYSALGRPRHILPPSFGGAEELLVALDFSSITTGIHSHFSLDTVDDRDWRNRICWWECEVHSYLIAVPWDPAVSATSPDVGFAGTPVNDTTNVPLRGTGQTIIRNNGINISNTSLVAFVSDAYSNSTLGTAYLYCDHADGGKLKVYKSSTNPRAYFMFRLHFSAPFANVR